ncbi:MAG: hypothetical protein ACPGUD_08935 [Parashewanella sp.]
MFKKSTIAAMLLASSSSAFATEVTKDTANAFFEKLMTEVQNESESYFDLFEPNAAITYNLPESYGIASGKMKFNEYKQAIEMSWSYTENHSYDIEKPIISVKNGIAEINVTMYERYTMQGYTSANKSVQQFEVKSIKGQLKIVALTNNVTDIPETDAVKADNSKSEKTQVNKK